jgi:hypothetical protein
MSAWAWAAGFSQGALQGLEIDASVSCFTSGIEARQRIIDQSPALRPDQGQGIEIACADFGEIFPVFFT